MWYEKIIALLLEKINPQEKQKAEFFLQKFFLTLSSESIFNHQEPPLETMLGIIDKMYVKFAGEPTASVSLKDFSQYLFGLLIVYMKVGYDQAVLSADFIALFNKVQKELALSTQSQNTVLTINALVKIILADLRFNTTVNLEHLLTIFAQSNSREAIRSFYTETALLTDISEKFKLFKQQIFAHYLTEEEQNFYKKLDALIGIARELIEKVLNKSLNQLDQSFWQNLKFDKQVKVSHFLDIFIQLGLDSPKAIKKFYIKTIFLKEQSAEFDSLREEIFNKFIDEKINEEIEHFSKIAIEFTEKAKTNSLQQLKPSILEDFTHSTIPNYFLMLFSQLNSRQEIRNFYEKTEFLKGQSKQFDFFRKEIFQQYFTTDEQNFYSHLDIIIEEASKEIQDEKTHLAFLELKKFIVDPLNSNISESNLNYLLTFFNKFFPNWLIKNFYDKSDFLKGKNKEFDIFRKEIFHQHFTNEEQNFLTHLDSIEEKAKKFRERAEKKPKYTKAANTAMTLSKELKTVSDVYFKEQNLKTYETFQKNCAQAISDSRPELENYRGWGLIFANVALGIWG